MPRSYRTSAWHPRLPLRLILAFDSATFFCFMVISGAMLLLCSDSNIADAQDNHYWTQQFGGRSALMGGAVVGGVRDTSAGYYNPGALGFVENPSLSVSANGYQLERLTLSNAAGQGADLSSTEIKPIPLLLSGIKKFKDSPEHSIGYSLVSRQRQGFRATARRDERINVIDDRLSPGPEEYVGQYTVSTDLNELWGGLTYAYRPTEHFSVGLTHFLAYRSQSASTLATARTINNSVDNNRLPPVSISDLSATYDFYNVRSVIKLGAAAEWHPLKLGIAVTAPGFDLFGNGDVAVNETLAGLPVGPNGSFGSLVGDDRQENLDSRYQSPMSIATGLEWDLGSTHLALSGEYFFSISPYGVLRPASRSFYRSNDGVSRPSDVTSGDLLRVLGGADGVMNTAVAVEQEFTDDVKGYLSWHTDLSAAADIPDPGLEAGFTNWDIYHFTVGTAIAGERSELALGLVYSFARRGGFPAPVNFSNPSQENRLLGDFATSDVSYNSASVLLGYTYFFE